MDLADLFALQENPTLVGLKMAINMEMELVLMLMDPSKKKDGLSLELGQMILGEMILSIDTLISNYIYQMDIEIN